MLKLAICEDQASHADLLHTLLRHYEAEHPRYQIGVDTYGSAEALLAALEQGAAYHIFLLDVVMPGMSGIALARALRERNRKSAVIFLTASPDYAVEAFSVKAWNYLLKPVTREGLAAALNDALEVLEPQIESYAIVHGAEGDQRIAMSDILCVEVTGHVLRYTLSGGVTVTSRVLRISFETAVADLLADGRFLQPHRSFVVNAAHIVRITPREFILENGDAVPISRLRLSQVKAAYIQYLARQEGRGIC